MQSQSTPGIVMIGLLLLANGGLFFSLRFIGGLIGHQGLEQSLRGGLKLGATVMLCGAVLFGGAVGLYLGAQFVDELIQHGF